MSKNLYVGNIQWDTTEKELEEIFTPFGKVHSVQIIKDHNSGRSKGFGFVEMENADEAMQNLHGKELRNRSLKINEARERTSRRTFS